MYIYTYIYIYIYIYIFRIIFVFFLEDFAMPLVLHGLKEFRDFELPVLFSF